MSAATTSNTDGLETVHVKLTDEAVAVWRPAKARRLGTTIFLLIDQDIPEGEEWEFQPGDRVVATETSGDHGRTYLRAVRAAAPVPAE